MAGEPAHPCLDADHDDIRGEALSGAAEEDNLNLTRIGDGLGYMLGLP